LISLITASRSLPSLRALMPLIARLICSCCIFR
jgi:hypothetical protein